MCIRDSFRPYRDVRFSADKSPYKTHLGAVAGVVASLALSVALTVMVSSFRSGVTNWLDVILPADIYARSAGNAAATDQAWLPASFATQAAAVPGVQRAQAMRVRSLALAPGQPLSLIHI